jgi:DNA-binding GntR family transcriptional regulator
MSDDDSPALPRASLAELVYDRMLSSILSGELAGGETINLSDVSRECGVSSIPVREAVVRLACEGLVCCEANRRATVEIFTRGRLVEIFQVREFLEVGAARLAAERISAEAFEGLCALDTRIAELADKPRKRRDLLDAENRFHTQLVAASGNALLSEEYQRYRNHIAAFWANHPLGPKERLALPDHSQIVEALKQHDPESAATAIREHIQAALARLMLRIA